MTNLFLYFTTQRLQCRERGAGEMEQNLHTGNGQTSKASGTLQSRLSLLAGVLNSLSIIVLPVIMWYFLFGGPNLHLHMVAYYEAQATYYNDRAIICATGD